MLELMGLITQEGRKGKPLTPCPEGTLKEGRALAFRQLAANKNKAFGPAAGGRLASGSSWQALLDIPVE